MINPEKNRLNDLPWSRRDLEKNIEVRLFKLSVSNITEVIIEVMLAKGLILGSPTLNNGIMLTIAGFITYMKGLKPKGKIGTVFGSYG